MQLFPKIIHYPHKLVAYKPGVNVLDYLRGYIPRFAKPRARLVGFAKVMLLSVVFSEEFKVAAVAALVALARAEVYIDAVLEKK